MFFEVRKISKHFGGLMAVADLSFSVEDNQLLAVIGPNGAGKTTLFNLITGTFHPDSGDIYFQDRKITRFPAHKLCRYGLTRSFQITNIFQSLSVFENIRLACQARSKGFHLFNSVSSLNEAIRDAERIIELINLSDKHRELAGNLSHGDQRYLEIGLALAARPRLILLDEPTAGMTPTETNATINLIKHLRQTEHMAILLIEHDIDLIFEVSDRILVMHQGRLLAEGLPEQVRQNEAVQEAYFGVEM